jgi:formylmethanofuran dehydrogenase subunit B
MNVKRLLGLDTLAADYAYAADPIMGHTSARKIPDRWVRTTCGYCSVGCGMFIGVKEGRAVSVRGDADHPVNAGALCPKGLSEHETMGAADRARTPLLRRHGRLRRAGWDDAIGAMVKAFRDTQARYGPDSVGVISTGQLVTEEFYTLGKLVQLGLGTRHYDGNTTLCMSTAVAGYKRSFGSDGPPGAYEDFERADVILLIGANIADNHPILWQRLERNENKTLIVVDPRVTKTAMRADLHLPLKPRSDLALINGLIHILIQANLVDRDYVAAHTTGFDALRESVRRYTPEHVAAITGLSTEQLYKTAWLYGRARAAVIGWTMGVNHSSKGTETVNAINNLALITGQIGRVGAAPFSITGQCNAMGTREAGFTSSLPGYRKFESQEDREALAALWSIPVERIPAARGHAYPDIIEAALRGEIRALWIIGTNPIVSYPNLGVLQQSLESLDFLVVQDGFHPTPTTAIADLVLPAAMWGEKEGTFTNSERRVSKVNRAVGSARRGAQRLRHLSRRRRRARLSRGALSRLGDSGGRVRRVEARLGWPPVRLLRHVIRRARARRRNAMAVSRRQRARDGCPPPLYGRRVPDRRRQGAPDSHRVGALPRAAQARLSPDPEHGPHGRALAHAHQDRPRADSRLAVAVGVGGSQSARRAARERQAIRSRRRGFAARPDPQPAGPPDRNRRARPGLRPLPLGGVQREPGDAERVRSNLARTQLQAVRGPARADGARRRLPRRTPRRRAMKKLVVVGNGMAGVACVEQIIKALAEVRDHGVRRRDARQLQPDPAVRRSSPASEPPTKSR